MKFQPGKTRNEVVAIYVNGSLSIDIIEFDTENDKYHIAISCTNLNKEKNECSLFVQIPFGQKRVLHGAF